MLFVRPINPEGQGERLLLASVLRRACYDIALYKGAVNLKKRRLWMEAQKWMFVDNLMEVPPEDRFTSFISICTVLDRDPSAIREKALLLTSKDIRKFEMVSTHGRIYR